MRRATVMRFEIIFVTNQELQKTQSWKIKEGKRGYGKGKGGGKGTWRPMTRIDSRSFACFSVTIWPIYEIVKTRLVRIVLKVKRHRLVTEKKDNLNKSKKFSLHNRSNDSSERGRKEDGAWMTKLNMRAPKMMKGPACETMLVARMAGRGKSAVS